MEGHSSPGLALRCRFVFIDEASVIERILRHLRLPTEVPTPRTTTGSMERGLRYLVNGTPAIGRRGRRWEEPLRRPARQAQWVNRKTDYEVTLLDRNNELLVQQSFDDVHRLLDVPSSTLVEMSRCGAWLSAVPTLDAAGKFATLLAGGKRIAVTLADGHLTAMQ
jgi:hypothetical protein